ncbi:chemotaxis protein CheB [Hyphococcus luteus]|uniref:histidine kinase n=1 Tax=Hyphococcus luteus TaxID=2058213 RepID=A0A2S7K3S4_9PROT|nr:chemotaxis protein CheB [Marinicaulis flavus]PQA87152.1 histidine kinase [Marinicaulis flavus]
MTESRSPKSKSARAPSNGREKVAIAPDETNFLVVGIGASAGGLDACNKLLDAIPAKSGMAFIIVQHLDPTHESMMVDLLSRHAAISVQQATDGMPLERGNIYVIPPGADISVEGHALRLSQTPDRHGARLPFDFLLRSMAETLGLRAACVILSGTGADGSLGLKAIRESGGLVIAQKPEEASHDGMPRSAIATGAVDLVLPVSEIPDALDQFERRMTFARKKKNLTPSTQDSEWLPEIIALLRTRTGHDFTLYKSGTLQRRIDRRMALAMIDGDDMACYLEKLRNDQDEIELLAKDLLINVTSFFRGPDVFAYLEKNIVPDLVAGHDVERPLRLWIAGCSTGEESYSLAMLFQEQISAIKRNVRLQVFASDLDADAVARAREGLYPETIEADVSPERLKRFFDKEGRQYRVKPELRAAVVFTEHDVLSDPPFSGIDFVSCRNLLIYLRPEAQAKVISIFRFALRADGVLLLGGAELVGAGEAGFEIVSKPQRLYRRVGHHRPSEFAELMAENVRAPSRIVRTPARAQASAFAEFCERLVMENYAPAAVLINRKQECLFTLGSTDPFMQLAPGLATRDLIASSREFVRAKLRSALQKAWQADAKVVVKGRRASRDKDGMAYRIEASPTVFDGEKLMLVCFVEEPAQEERRGAAPTPGGGATQVAELERELDETRTELESAIRSLEVAEQEHQAINEEALSVNEEYQSTNEELETSKEELQSLNEELTALNSQLQEALELQRTASDDLQNVLYSSDVATIFLDTDLRIRLFTPAAKGMFHIITSDIGRSLSDLNPLAADPSLLSDASQVLQSHEPLGRDINVRDGAWYSRRIMPYRTQGGDVEGVVITFIDITERRRIADALAAANEKAQRATEAKSRFLAAASHDLRQPLQTLVFLHGLLAKSVEGKRKQDLVVRMGDTVDAMSGMLNALLDLNQIEANALQVETRGFSINNLLVRLRDQFTYQAQSQGIDLRFVESSLVVESDPRLLEQMVRNLLSNAIKYTTQGKVLVGCRRKQGRLRIEVWDTGAGIPEDQLPAVFEEYHQLDNVERERSRGFGLGLSIVQRLGDLLGHQVDVRSQAGKGSVFSIGVGIAHNAPPFSHEIETRGPVTPSIKPAHQAEAVLVVEDNHEVRELLQIALTEEGYPVAAAEDGAGAMELVSSGKIKPDIIVADFSLPNGMNGAEVAESVREILHSDVPVIILTGDISIEIFRSLALPNCARLNKPVNLNELTQAMRQLLTRPPKAAEKTLEPSAAGHAVAKETTIFVIDDDSHIRDEVADALGGHIWGVKTYSTCEAFLAEYHPGSQSCLLVDCRLPGMDGFQLLRVMRDRKLHLPVIMITGYGDVPTAVRAMKAGAIDFIEKPIAVEGLVAAVERALEASQDINAADARQENAEKRIASLTPRQRQVMDLVLAGQPSKNIAADLGISQRTVENHRAAVMKSTGARSLPELARLVVTAA